MRVDQDDFVGRVAVDLALMSQSQHVLRELLLAFGAGPGLTGHERLEALAAQSVEHVAGGYVGVTRRARFVGRLGEHGGGGLDDLAVREGAVGTDDPRDLLE